MKKENKVLLKVLVEKRHKKWIENEAKIEGVSEAEIIRGLLTDFMSTK